MSRGCGKDALSLPEKYHYLSEKDKETVDAFIDFLGDRQETDIWEDDTEEPAVPMIDGFPFKISMDQLAFTEDRDRIYTHLILMDYDWMHYRLQAEIPITKKSVMLAEFEYYGSTPCMLHVEFRREKACFLFPSSIYRKHVKKFMDEHRKHWNRMYAFGGEQVLEFWNDVMEHHEKKMTGESSCYCHRIKIPKQ